MALDYNGEDLVFCHCPPMHQLVTAALDAQDYRRATQLIKQWRKASPKDPLVLLSIGRLQEGTLQWDAAEKTYLTFLKRVNNPKLMGQARSGLKRVQQAREASRQADLDEATAVLGSDDPGLLAIMPPDDAKQAAVAMAEVLRIDPYMARLQLPKQGLRLQRTGSIGEMKYYGEALQAAGVPATWATIEELKKVQVFEIKHFRTLTPQPAVVCQSPTGQMGSIQFDWSEISQIIRAQLPVFEEVSDKTAWGKSKRKELVQDYAQVMDLHIHGRKIILRGCDRTYEFRNSVALVPDQTNLTSTRIRWNGLLQHINRATHCPQQTDFTNFGQGALEMMPLLPYIKVYLDLNRRKPSDWDTAFQIYSTLLFRQMQA
ncbi:tetratricopeptide repeat protein [Leptothoe kymatousa TAU-MAC 1615]|uniref:Tetratricopeptide repeat protein n=2 Tax=Leptothoe TaxID=2651725 RepID=A0ABS5Y6L9_9CYAN|nr:tetratricopeptide repeat protein [Leptothoe kymatousa TAU-MAC 1615]